MFSKEDNSSDNIMLLFLILILEGMGFFFSITDRGTEIFEYYTQISNILGVISIVLLIFDRKESAFTTVFRFTSVSMMILTLIIALFVLAPFATELTGKLVYLINSNGLYHHVLCPLLSLISYVFFEKHVRRKYVILIPLGISCVYAVTMIVLNYLNRAEGPYPFFQIDEIGFVKTLIWFIVLGVSDVVVSLGIFWLGSASEKKKEQ